MGSSSGDSDFELTPRLGGISKVSLSPNSSEAGSYSSTSIDLTSKHKPSQSETAPLNLSGSDDAYDSDHFENIATHADDDVNLSGSDDDGLPSPLTTTKTGVVANHFFYSEDDFSVAAPEERPAGPEQLARSTATSARPQSTAASARSDREGNSPMDTARSLDSQDLVSQRNTTSHPPPPVIPTAATPCTYARARMHAQTHSYHRTRLSRKPRRCLLCPTEHGNRAAE